MDTLLYVLLAFGVGAYAVYVGYAYFKTRK
jgi:hypothetical protein